MKPEPDSLSPAMASARENALGHRRLLLCMLVISIIAACSAPRAVPPPAPQSSAKAAPAPLAAPKSVSRTLSGYKEDAARRISEANKSQLYEGAPPSMLKSVVVLSIAIDAHGKPTRVAVLRSNGFAELDDLAVQSVRRAAPLPLPDRAIMRGSALEYTETWFFRDDGRFQIRSLALAQQSGLN
jgi:protein TonB